MNNQEQTTNELQKSFEYIRQLKNKVYPSEILKFVFNLKLNDHVYGWGEKKPYTVVYVDNRYVVLGKKMFGQSMHSIIDKGKLIIGAGDRWQFGNYVKQDLSNVLDGFPKYIKHCEDVGIDVISCNNRIDLADELIHEFGVNVVRTEHE